MGHKKRERFNKAPTESVSERLAVSSVFRGRSFSVCAGSMSNFSCIFCKIIEKQLPARVVAENNEVLVINDISPKAPVHFLIISKKHIENIKGLQEADSRLMSAMLLMAKELAAKLEGDGAFRIISNNGVEAGQSVAHMHFHFLSGKKMVDF